MAIRKGLGRGLSALMDELDAPPATADGAAGRDGGAEHAAAPERGVAILPLASIDANPDQPRRQFDEVALHELADSIRVKGVLQPILVRPAGGRYQLVAGERRWRAAQMAGLHDIPVVIRGLSPGDAFEAAIIENVQRADLNPMEEAQAYATLMRDHGHTQEMVAAVVGKARSHVANLVRLLDLPEDVQAMVRIGALSMGHARAALQAADPVALARMVAEKGLSVRQAEAEARRSLGAGRSGAQRQVRARAADGPRDADLEALEAALAETLGLPVAIEAKDGRGTLTVRFSDLDQLDAVIARLQGG